MNLKTQLLLENQLCFSIYSTSLAMTQEYKKHLEPLGLTYTKYTLMLILWEEDGVTLKSMADRLGQKSGALTPVVKRMESDGLIKRQRGKDDDRALHITLTRKGRELKTQALKISTCIAESCGLQTEQIVDLTKQLTELKQKLSQFD